MIVAEILRNGRNGRDPWRPRVKRDGSRPVVELGGREIRSMTREVVDVETILACQERLGIDRVLLSPWVPLLYPEAEPESCLERCRIQNEALEGLVRATPDRIAALGAVPLQAPSWPRPSSLAAAGVLSGVEVTASVGATTSGTPCEPFWAVAERTGSWSSCTPRRGASMTPCSAATTSGTRSAIRSRRRSPRPR